MYGNRKFRPKIKSRSDDDGQSRVTATDTDHITYAYVSARIDNMLSHAFPQNYVQKLADFFLRKDTS